MHTVRVGGWWRIGILTGLLSLILIAAVTILAPRPDSALANPATDIVSMTSGTAHTCALTSGGGVRCWGDNVAGMVGDGTTTNRSVPTNVVGLTNGVTAIAAGTNHTCALTGAGGVTCWGLNRYGQLGSGTLASSSSPVDVVGLTTGATAVGTGWGSSCAVTAANEVQCWGNGFGTTPVAIPNSSDVTQIAGGTTHTCALTNSGGVICWGSNLFGELGNGTRTPSTVPVDVVGLSGVVALAQSSPGATDFSCALLATDDVQCWGRNHFGQLGSSTGELCGGSPCSTVPISVPGLNPNVVGVAIGTYNACAATATTVQCWGAAYGSAATDVPGFNGSIIGVTRGTDHGCAWTATNEAECWGANGHGQLGDGTTNSSVTPVAVVELAAKPTATPTPCPKSGCPEPTPVCASQACMALAVKDASGDIVCQSDGNATCSIALSDEFTLAVLATKPPAGGYHLAQAWIDYGSVLEYTAAPAAADEVSWPDATFSLRGFHPTAVYLGALTGLIPPQPVSFFAGEIFEFAFACTTTPSSSVVELLPYLDPVAYTDGALYVEGETGGPQITPEVGSLNVNCVDPATTGDTDGDGCDDILEIGTDETLGGLRDPRDEWDFYDTNGDAVIDLSNDIFDVIQHYAPTGTELEYDVAFDRGPAKGPSVWNMTAPDGVIDLTNDIMGVIQQYLHDCS